MKQTSIRVSSLSGPSPPAQRRIPGPPGLPWLGQLPAFLRSKFFPKQMLKWAEEYNGVYGMELAGRKYLVVSDPALMALVMGRGGPGLPKSDGYAMWDRVISPHPGVQGVFTVADNTEMWRTVRRSYGPGLGLASLGHHYPTLLRCTAQLGRYVEAQQPQRPEAEAQAAQAAPTGFDAAADAAASPLGPQPPSASSGLSSAPSLEINRLLKSLSLDMLGRCAFDVDLGCLTDPPGHRLGHNLERAMEEAGALARNPARRLLPWLYEEEQREGQAATAAFQAVIEDVWRDIKARGPPAKDDDSMAAQFMRLADPARGTGALSEAQICAEIATIVVAGYETTANMLTWMLFAVHAHPGAAARLEEELRSAGLVPSSDDEGGDGRGDGFGDGGDPSLDAFLALPGGHETLSSLPYLDAFVRECLRVFTVAPNGAIKQVPHDGPPARIGPYDVDPGTTVWIPFWSLHLSERNWERPLDFKPERWLGLNPRTGFAAAAAPTSRCPVSAAVGVLRAATGGGGGDAHAAAAAHNAASTASSSSTSSSSSCSKASRFMPFSDGSRNCVGYHLGMLQLKVVLSYMVSRFRIRLDERRMGGVGDALERQRVNLTLEVEGGMWLQLEPRGWRGMGSRNG